MQHPDEGTIHAWLDGALPEDEARALESHVTDCAECQAAVAEARGLIAASSRILLSLDDVPSSVAPVAVPPRAAQLPRRIWGFSPTALRAAAALLIVAVGTYAVVDRRKTENTVAPTATMESVRPSMNEAPRVAADAPAAAAAAPRDETHAYAAGKPMQDAARVRAEAPARQPTPTPTPTPPTEAPMAAGAVSGGIAGAGATMNSARAPVPSSAQGEQKSAMQRESMSAVNHAALGCWTMSIEVADADAAKNDAQLAALPRRVRLESDRTSGASTPGYVLSALGPSTYRSAYWEPLSSDEVKLAWTMDGSSWLTMTLHLDGDQLSGDAQIPAANGQPAHTERVVARRLSCG